MLRCLAFITTRFQFSLRAVHIPGEDNSIADTISRNNMPVSLPTDRRNTYANPQQPTRTTTRDARLDITEVDQAVDRHFQLV